MKFVVRPELPTAALRSSQATLAAVDNSAPLATRRSPLKTRGNVVQTTGATSLIICFGLLITSIMLLVCFVQRRLSEAKVAL